MKIVSFGGTFFDRKKELPCLSELRLSLVRQEFLCSARLLQKGQEFLCSARLLQKLVSDYNIANLKENYNKISDIIANYR